MPKRNKLVKGSCAESAGREEAFADLQKIAQQARERWEAEGKTEDDIECLVKGEVEAVRGELYKQGAQTR